MSWAFLAVLFSGWLFVDASYRGPRWQRWVFKPVTLLLLLLLAWSAPNIQASGYLILLGHASACCMPLARFSYHIFCTPSASPVP